MAKYSADRIVKALATKHVEDVFVPECKNGPTQQGSHLRLDAWALLKTWSPVTTIGYEVKVSRSDWRRDAKVQDYAGLCHLLYIVAPKGIVPLEEIPASWGLMEICGPTDRIVTRRRAERREIEMPVSLLVYVLMCRVNIKNERPADVWDARSWRVRELREWLNGREERRILSHAVSEKIRAAFDAQALKQRELERTHEELQSVKRRIEELGFDPNQSVNSWRVNERLNELGAIVSSPLLWTLKQAAGSLTKAHDELQRFQTAVKPAEKETA